MLSQRIRQTHPGPPGDRFARWWAICLLALKNLALQKLRSGLALLGVILGVASVIAMLAIAEGSKLRAVEQIRQLGATNLIIRSVKPGQADNAREGEGTGGQQRVSRIVEYGLRYSDFERLRLALPTVRQALPVSLIRRNAQRAGRRMANARILGVVPEHRIAKRLNIRRGRFIAAPDLEKVANVAVLSSRAAERLFDFEDPLGQAVFLGSAAFRVVGVLKAASAGASAGDSAADEIYIPLTAARWRFGELQTIRSAGSVDLERTQLSEIVLRVSDVELVGATAAMARKLLDKEHPLGDDYEMQVPHELLRQAEQEGRIWNLVLGSIAGISLLVGGIGITNIMLATVTERTREIGIRRALGARRHDIAVQFLIESLTLASTGGLLGIGLGIVIPLAVESAFGIETAVRLWSVLLAFGISTGVGVLFGLYPACRASRMNPIEALRHA